MSNRTKFNTIRKHYIKENINKCVNCHSTKDLTLHHIIPLALGGTNNVSNIVFLCGICHGKIHKKSFINHRELTKKGLEKAKLEGRIGGRRQKLSDKQKQTIYDLYQAKANTVQEIADLFKITRPTVYKIIKEISEKN